MPKMNLEATIAKLVQEFSVGLIDVVKKSSLEDLLILKSTTIKTGRKPGPKAGKKKAKKVTSATFLTSALGTSSKPSPWMLRITGQRIA